MRVIFTLFMTLLPMLVFWCSGHDFVRSRELAQLVMVTAAFGFGGGIIAYVVNEGRSHQ